MIEDRKNKVPTPEDTAGTCRRCGAYANFKFDVSRLREWELYPPEIGMERLLTCWCELCKKETLVVQTYTALPTEQPGVSLAPNWILSDVWPPVDAAVPDYIPDDIGELYREAATCLSACCYRATAIMTRGAIDAAMEDQQATGRTLKDKINSMQGKLRQQLIDIANTLRLGGNDAAHVFSEDWDQEEASELFAFLGEVLRELYETPQRLANLHQLGDSRRKR